jgi:hypothetical protein
MLTLSFTNYVEKEWSGKSEKNTENAQHILTRLYVKDFNGKNRVRIERQEYPRKENIDRGYRREIGNFLVD